MITRRAFIRKGAIVAGGTLIAPASFMEKPKHEIGIQLYSLREHVGKNQLKSTIQKIAAAGYTNVETYGLGSDHLFFGHTTPANLYKMLNEAGLKTTSGHYIPEDYLFGNASSDAWKKVVEAAVTLKQDCAVVPYVPENFRTKDLYQKLIAKLSEAGEICRQGGIKIGYHNHQFEFDPIGDSFGLDILLKGTDPALVDFELDIYWSSFAGKNAIDLFKKYPGRFKMWHVKDMNKKDRNRNTEIGSGTIDYKSIFSEAKLSGLKHFFVEQETYDMDTFESIRKSNEFLKTKIL